VLLIGFPPGSDGRRHLRRFREAAHV